MRKSVISILFITLLVFCFSCSNKDKNKKYLIQPKFEKGQKYYFISTSQSSTTINANAKQIEMSNKTETGFIYELLNDSVGFRQLKITYDAFKATIRKDEQVQELDISNNPDLINPVNKFISRLKGASVIVYMDSKGKLLELKGYKELTDSLLLDENTKQMFRQKLSGLIGEGLIKSNMEQGFGLFPDSAIAVGYKWQKLISQKSEIDLTFSNNYFFEDVKDGVAYLESKADINTENSNISIMNINLTASLKGKQTSNFKIDINNGMVLEGKTKTNIEGSMQAMGKDVPISIETSTTTSSRKM